MSFKTLNIGTTAMMANQLALNTVGHNVANAATEGYARQRVHTAPVTPENRTFGILGGGAEVKSVKHVVDDFLERQLRENQGLYEYLESHTQSYGALETIFNELTENDLSTAFDDFWNALSDFTNHTEDVSTRRALIEQADSLTETLATMDRKLYDMRERMNENVVASVDKVNTLIEEISTLNKQILHSEFGGLTGAVANDLRDERTTRLKELAGLLDITVKEESNGSVVVSLKGRLLVFEGEYFELTTEERKDGDHLIDAAVFAKDLDDIEPGKAELGAFIEIRDSVLTSFKDEVDRLAATFMWEFNRLHSQGQGLLGYSTMTGSTPVIDPTVALDELEFEFDPMSDTYAVQNGNFEIHVRNEVTGEVTEINIEIDLDDNTTDPDTILYDATNPPPADNNALVNKMQNALDDAFPATFDVSIDTSNRVVIESTSSSYTFGFGRDTSGVLATLGLNTFFSGYDARSAAVEENIRRTPEYVAGASEFVPGDNSNGVSLLALRDAGIYNNDTSTIDDYYQGIVGRLGIETSQNRHLFETQRDLLMRVENEREDLSGVNLDEELSLMIQYQRSFQSAARFISTADTIYESLLTM